ncbi:MAG: hypothetical protein KBF21_03665 [Thermoanaerobaculia bacterium]|jgi:suppressor for copper-sensitivity B|nr:hypothetical protein [Thermoanaerobaculia bacterium]MBP9823302.1 hypothetical protein [Thermoanaerobaculia bacterium]
MKLIGMRDSGLALALLAGLPLLGAAALPAEAAREAGAMSGATGPWVANGQARARLIAAGIGPTGATGATRATGAAGTGAGDPVGEIELGLEFELEPGWHVYWKNSGDAGYPPRLDLSGTPALAGAQLLFPAPQRYDLPGGLVSFGYEGHVIYPLSAGLPVLSGESLPPVSARLDYLVCRAECIPHTADLTLDLESVRQGTGAEALATAARLTAAREALPREPGAVAGAPQVSVRVEPGPASSLVLVFATSGGSLRAARPDLFFEVHPFFALERPEISSSDDGLLFRVTFRPLDETQPMPATTTFAWTLTGLERAPGTGDVETGQRPSAVALAGSASVKIPHLRTSESLPSSGLRPGLVLPLLVAGLILVFFLIHRSRQRRS